ncbi:MAG: AAA family ATPase [Patescibacteria group bacterium]|nr:AAA family ATPase [Patescibacteria group bacterium]
MARFNLSGNKRHLIRLTIGAALLAGTWLLYTNHQNGQASNARTETVDANDGVVVIQADQAKQVKTPGGNIEIRVEPASGGSGNTLLIVLMVASLLGFGALILYNGHRVAKSQIKDRAQFSKAAFKRFDNSTVRFSDVAGIDEVRQRLEDLVDVLRHPEKYAKLGGKIPRGVLLHGLPGVGKTLIAMAVAGEAGVPYFSMSGSEFVEMFVGVGASRIRDLFAEARKAGSCIIFIDEVDALGGSRDRPTNGGAEHEQTLNQLLAEMDGINTDGCSIMVIGATNRMAMMDPALLRDGRFDFKVYVPMPDMNGRLAILRVHASKRPMDDDVDLSVIAKSTATKPGSTLAAIMNEASLKAARRGAEKVGQADLIEAMNEKLLGGPVRRSLRQFRDEIRAVAIHEAGHGLATHRDPDADPLRMLSILPRESSLGIAVTYPDHDHHGWTKKGLCSKMRFMLGGRAAETLFLDDISSGADADIQSATSIAEQMARRLGMVDELGPRCYGRRDDGFCAAPTTGDISEATKARIDAAVDGLLAEALAEDLRVLTAHKDEHAKLVAALMERETLCEEEIIALVGPRSTA